MDEDIITLSSDEDVESPRVSSNPDFKNGISKNVNFLKERLEQNLASVLKKSNQAKVKRFTYPGENALCPTPEVVDLVDPTEKSPESGHSNYASDDDETKNHSNGTDAETNVTCKSAPLNHHLNENIIIGETPNDKPSNVKDPSVTIETSDKMPISKVPQLNSPSHDAAAAAAAKNHTIEDSCVKVCENAEKKTPNEISVIFKEFVDYCATFEENPKHREKVIEKLTKYFANAEVEYVRSKEFRNLITKCKDKITIKNMYLVVKTIADELKLHKSIHNQLKHKSAKVEGNSQVEGEENSYANSPVQKRRLAKVQKIMKKLNELGSAIRELETQEVDLSDEENSVYLKLQRYRERFWVIYKKLSEYTKDVSLERVLDEKIHFSETKYPAINRCIEKWLNKTRRFPDFADILKILESQSTELGLPSNKDSLRALAVEIFQKVGEVLQRKRKYDLWNSFSEFLEDTEDPAANNPELEKIFKENYEIRVKKEQEIYQLYAECQEKESLQPKEVSEEDSYRSPESGNEEEEEIISIEESLAEKLFHDQTDQDKEKSDDTTNQSANVSFKEKESKNNFKNCKSLKWRSERRGDGSCSSAAETDGDTVEKTPVPHLKEKDSSPELILMEPDNHKTDISNSPRAVSTNAGGAFRKRKLPCENGNCSAKKKSGIVHLRGNENTKTPIFDVGYCQIFTNHNFKERRKVFRDLTNIKRLMKKPELRDKITGLFTPAFLYSRCSLKKEAPWKKRFKINLREIKPKNQKCALNEEEKTNEKISSTSSRGSEDKESKDDAGSGREGADFSGQGNGQEEDNNDKGDENRKNGKVEGENDDHEEDDDEEKEDENAETGEHFSNTEKTEKKNEDSLETTTNENHTLDEAEKMNVENNENSEVEDIVNEGTKEEEEKEENEQVDGNLESCVDYDESCRDIGNKFKDSEDAEEFENLKNSLEPICVLKEGDASDVIEKANNDPLGVHQRLKENTAWSITEKLKEEKEKTKAGPFTRSKLKMGARERRKNESYSQKRLPTTAAWTPPSETSQPKPRKMSASDEERVKRFLLHSPSSISITPPKKLTLSKPPSQSALQALATLRNLKGISATIVKGKPKKEEMTMIGDQSKRSAGQSTPVTVKRRRPDLPVISNVQSVNTLTPKIVTVQGNVSGFGNLWPEMKNNGNPNSDSSSIRISNVWGSLPESLEQGSSPSHYPGCSSRKSNPGISDQMRKKNSKKQVEYVVLD